MRKLKRVRNCTTLLKKKVNCLEKHILSHNNAVVRNLAYTCCWNPSKNMCTWQSWHKADQVGVQNSSKVSKKDAKLKIYQRRGAKLMNEEVIKAKRWSFLWDKYPMEKSNKNF